MKSIIIFTLLLVSLLGGFSFAAELRGTLHEVLNEQRTVVIDHRQYLLTENAVVRWQSDSNMLVLLGPMLHGHTVLYELVYSGQVPMIKKLVIQDKE